MKRTCSLSVFLVKLAGIVWISYLASCLAGCQTSTAQPTPKPEQTKAVVLFELVRPDGSSANLVADDLKELSRNKVEIEGNTVEGVKILDVFQAFQVTNFAEITLVGTDKSMTLQRADVDDQFILDDTQPGTVNMATPQVPPPEWVMGITKILVR